MGLFDPPSVSIARRVPMSAQSSLAVIQQFTELHVSPSVGHAARANIIGMVIRAWVMAHARSGTFDMLPHDFDAVKRTYESCSLVLKSRSVIAFATINALTDAGFMPFDATNAATETAPAARHEPDQTEHQPLPGRTMTDEELLSRRAALDRDLGGISRKR